MTIAYIGLGANIGERHENLKKAIDTLDSHEGVTVTKQSSIFETKPYGKIDQPDFLNMVIEVETTLKPIQLLEFALHTELNLGRVRKEIWGPRNIDIDILIYEDLEINTSRLIVPHEEMHLREFVLEPFDEIAPNVIHPIFNKTVHELLEDLKRGETDV